MYQRMDSLGQELENEMLQQLKSCEWFNKLLQFAKAIWIGIGGYSAPLICFRWNFLGRIIRGWKTFARKSNVNYHNEQQIDIWLKFEDSTIFNFTKDTFGDDDDLDVQRDECVKR